MEICVYFIIAAMVILGAALLWGKQNILKLYRRSILLSGRRFGGKAEIYSRKFKLRVWLRDRKGEKIDREVYEGISFLRNIIALGNGRRMGADYIIERLLRREGVLQPVYIKMLRFLRLGRLDDAIKAFSSEAYTSIGAEFGDLLLRWDSLDPFELTEILISYQKSIKEAKGTVQRKRDEMISELIYFPVVVNVFVIFINFITVGYFMEQKYLLSIIL